MSSSDNYKLHWKYTVTKTIRLSSKGQATRYQCLSAPNWGGGVAQSIGYKARQFTIRGQVVWFSAEATNTQPYFYEPNVMYTGFNFPAQHGAGMRYCLFVCYKPTPLLRLELKYGLTHRRDKNYHGSGHETLQGKIKNEIRLQVVIKF
jgi:hypothetical protein